MMTVPPFGCQGLTQRGAPPLAPAGRSPPGSPTPRSLRSAARAARAEDGARASSVRTRRFKVRSDSAERRQGTGSVPNMLVLTRRLGEVIRVGDAVTVRVLEVKGNQVRLGVEAPPEVRIYREEVYRAIRKENEDAARQKPSSLDEVTTAWEKQREKP